MINSNYRFHIQLTFHDSHRSFASFSQAPRLMTILGRPIRSTIIDPVVQLTTISISYPAQLAQLMPSAGHSADRMQILSHTKSAPVHPVLADSKSSMSRRGRARKTIIYPTRRERPSRWCFIHRCTRRMSKIFTGLMGRTSSAVEGRLKLIILDCF